MEEVIKGKHFSVTDPQNVNTIIYQINKTEKELKENSPKYTLERLEYIEEFAGTNKKKTFYVNEPNPEGNPLVILSFGTEKVVVNIGVLEEETVKISKQPYPMKFKTLYSEKETEYKEVEYTPNLKRPISIIDPETTEEIKPVLYFDEKTNEVKGKCKLKPYKSYFAFELKESNSEEE